MCFLCRTRGVQRELGVEPPLLRAERRRSGHLIRLPPRHFHWRLSGHVQLVGDPGVGQDPTGEIITHQGWKCLRTELENIQKLQREDGTNFPDLLSPYKRQIIDR